MKGIKSHVNHLSFLNFFIQGTAPEKLIAFIKMKIITATFLLSLLTLSKCFCTTTEDRSHFSTVLGMERSYRVFLPPDYKYSGKRYPVLYWFHGSGGSSKQDTYKSEFEDYLNNHDLILVNVDGTTASGATWDYGLAFEYKTRTQEGKAALTGMYFSKYIRELVGVIDSEYHTISDRDHRAVSGQSMGGLMAPWIASQNKDLFGSASMFSPSPDAAMFGTYGKEVCFVNSELYRSLKGLPLRVTIADGDRYIQYYHEQKAVWELADLTHLEYNEVNYPDHRAVAIPEQFDFHMAEFAKVHPFPQNWHHADPFTEFRVWNYEVSAEREQPAITIMEKVTPSGMILYSRSFLPNGPLISKEVITVTTDTLYSPLKNYLMTDYNLSTGTIQTSGTKSDKKGRLKFRVDGGGHALGINTGKSSAKLFLLMSRNSEERYCETGSLETMDFTLVNLGNISSGPIHIKATTPKSFLALGRDTLTLASLDPGQQVKVKDKFPYCIKSFDYRIKNSEDFVTGISLEVKCNDSVQDISQIFIYPVPGTSYKNEPSDLIVLDGGNKPAEVYNNRTHNTGVEMLAGGSGNANFIPEPGETIELYIRIPQGLGSGDRNTFHPAYLVNADECQWVNVDELKYNLKGAEYSGAPDLQSRIRIKPETPPGTVLNLWLKCESYEFSDEGFNRPVQRHRFDYVRVNIIAGTTCRKMP